MKSRISFFNFTVFFKDLLRLLPLWSIYLLLGVLFLFLKPIVSSNPIDYSDSLAFQKLTDNLCYLEYLIPVLQSSPHRSSLVTCSAPGAAMPSTHFPFAGKAGF